MICRTNVVRSHGIRVLRVKKMSGDFTCIVMLRAYLGELTRMLKVNL